MIRRLSNFLLLFGLLSLIVFFTSNTFLLDAGWFLVGGIGLTTLSLLLKRWGRNKKRRRKHRGRRKRTDQESDDAGE